MDGRFVPNITLRPVVVAAVRRATAKPLNVHLMIVEPERYLGGLRERRGRSPAGAVRAVLDVHLHRVLSRIRQLGKKAGAVLIPPAPIAFVEQVLHLCDVVLVMRVNPGFGGQEFLPEALPKIRELRRLCESRASTRGSRSTADRTPRMPGSPSQPAPTPSSPGRRFSARATTRRRSREFGAALGAKRTCPWKSQRRDRLAFRRGGLPAPKAASARR